MTYQIDQSGKIEHTNRTTVVAVANGKYKTIKISASEKQKLLGALKEIEHPKTNYIYKIFATLIFFLIENEEIKFIEIDREYFGHESVIKDMLIFLYNKKDKKIPEISFVLVGKKSNSHKVALRTFQSKDKPTIIVKAEKVLEVFFAKQKGRRSLSRGDNP